MKKIICIILTFLICFAFTACGGDEAAIDYKNTDNYDLQGAVRIIEDIYGDVISACYVANEDECPSQEVIPKELISSYFRFELKDGKNVILGYNSDSVYTAIKPDGDDKFYQVDITADGCIISDEICGQ